MEPIICPYCKSILILPDHYAGKKIACPGCKGEIVVPCAEEEQAGPPRTNDANQA